MNRILMIRRILNRIRRRKLHANTHRPVTIQALTIVRNIHILKEKIHKQRSSADMGQIVMIRVLIIGQNIHILKEKIHKQRSSADMGQIVMIQALTIVRNIHIQRHRKKHHVDMEEFVIITMFYINRIILMTIESFFYLRLPILTCIIDGLSAFLLLLLVFISLIKNERY